MGTRRISLSCVTSRLSHIFIHDHAEELGMSSDDGIDRGALVSTLKDHPVTVAILFGSYARGCPAEESDVDIAVAFDRTVDDEERLDARIQLILDLMDALKTDNIDVADLDSIRPEIGLNAMRSGELLIGDEEQLNPYVEDFEEARSNHEESHEDRVRRLGDIVDRLEAKL